MARNKVVKARRPDGNGPICRPCAIKLGGKWPEGHCATTQLGICPYCKSAARLAAESDWLWNGEKKLRNWD